MLPRFPMMKAGSHDWMFSLPPERAADLYKVAERHELTTECSMYTTVSTEEVQNAEMLIL